MFLVNPSLDGQKFSEKLPLHFSRRKRIMGQRLNPLQRIDIKGK